MAHPRQAVVAPQIRGPRHRVVADARIKIVQGQPDRPVGNAQVGLLLRRRAVTGAHGLLVKRQFPDLLQQIHLVVRLARKLSQIIKTGRSLDRALVMPQHRFGQADQQIGRHPHEHQAVNVLPHVSREGDDIVERIPEAPRDGRSAGRPGLRPRKEKRGLRPNLRNPFHRADSNRTPSRSRVGLRLCPKLGSARALACEVQRPR